MKRSLLSGVFFLLALLNVKSFAEETRAPRFSMYKPLYWHFTTGHPDKKVRAQFSAKYRMIDTGSDHKSGFYMGYTQRMLWDMWNVKRSWPIDDTNYQPELFYRQTISDAGSFVQFGGLHHSNGAKDVPDPLDPGDSLSKSYFGVYAQGRKAWSSDQIRLRLDGTLRSFNIDWENPDIGKYLGYLLVESELDFRFWKDSQGEYIFNDNTLFFSSNDSFTRRLSSRRPTAAAERVFSFEAGIYLGLGWLFRPMGWKAAASLFVHYFNGFGEYLSTYNDNREDRLYLGLALRPGRPWK